MNNNDYLFKYFEEYLGDSISMEIEFVDDIPPLARGKRTCFISKINAFQLGFDKMAS